MKRNNCSVSTRLAPLTPMIGDLLVEDPRQLGAGVAASRCSRHHDPASHAHAAQTVLPRRFADGLDDEVDRRRQARTGLNCLVRTQLQRRRRLSAERLVTITRSPAARASAIAAVATPPPAPWISTVSPGSAPPRVNSMRNAVVQATVMQPASSIVMNVGFGTRLRTGTIVCSAKAPGNRSEIERPVGVERFVAVAGVGIAERAGDDHLVAVLVPPGDVATENHRELIGAHARRRASTTGRAC